ncbi:MAG: bifunctional oligoribonuclease/PAP phosphatase NrnA [Calditrichaeota bacterium]|nr:bifunctional oligoribonuclease/PAP phosphatase NrnA [Calditrichota bacterium]
MMEKIVQFIKKSDHFLLTTHMNADGDAFASLLAVAYLLENWEKNYDMVIHDAAIDDKYSFMWGIDRIKTEGQHPSGPYKAGIILDVPSLHRIGTPASLLPSPEYCVKIDHHPAEGNIAYFNLEDPEASSTSQLIFELIKVSGFRITRDLAELIFSGIVYDTGRFSFSNTRQRDFQIAAELLELGIKPNHIANRLFFTNSFESMKILGYALSHMELRLNGKLSIIYLPLEIMDKNNHAEIEELANYSVSICGVEVGLFIREVKPRYFKISFRSKGRVNVNKIARFFGGGGHMHAAGARFSGDPEVLKSEIVKQVAACLDV